MSPRAKALLVIGGLIALGLLANRKEGARPPSAATTPPAVSVVAPSASSQARNLPQQAAPSPDASPRPERLKVRGSDVAFRAGPSRDARILDRLARGTIVDLVGRAGEWSEVRHPVTGLTGWVFSKLLEGESAEQEQPAPKQKPERIKPLSGPALSVAVIAQRLIAESRSSYPGSCACPYDVDRGGRRCGRRSAYSKPGGYAPLCYENDVTTDMIDAYRSRH